MKAICTGVSGSIGLAIARRFLEAFPEVDVTGTYFRNQGRAEDLSTFERFKLKQVDLSHPDTWDIPHDVDYVISCAGLSSGKSQIADIPREEIESLVAVNLLAPIYLAQRCIPHMLKGGFGRIVNINSIWGIRGSGRNGAYIATKHGLRGFTKAVAKDYGRLGVTCNDVCPGAVDSSMMNSYFSRLSTETGTEVAAVRSGFESGLNGGRMASPLDVAEAVIHLCSRTSSHINGTAIVIDGGETC